MTNEPLISQLDSLCSITLQQQKAAAALQKALKAVTDVQSKAQKTLRDYSAQNTGADIGTAQETFGQMRLKEEVVDPLLPDLRRELKALTALSSALKEAATALRSDPVDVTRLDKALSHLQAAKQPDIAELIPELSQELDVAQRVLGDEFGAKLRDALAERGISIGGRAPKFVIGRYELEANFAKRFLILRYGKDVVVPHISVTVEAALKAYQNAAKAIEGRSQDGKTWIAQFYEAYQRARRKLEIHGERVNIVDCYVEMAVLRQGRAFYIEPSKHTFSDYSRAQFIYDFYEFANRRRVAHNGQVVRAHSATKSQTDNAAKCMWIVEGDGPHDGRLIADVEFEKE
ncbi:MAG: hypothetical protein L6Q98_01350 [Anaerolineae bacterium]|nr:hypothetical protein [Anaerolineae bacterium]NUQ04416.1 hypothetical protein [Anaerolineae bacterium]